MYPTSGTAMKKTILAAAMANEAPYGIEMLRVSLSTTSSEWYPDLTAQPPYR